MTPLSRLLGYARREPWTCLMAFCLTAVMLVSWFAPRPESNANSLSESGRLATAHRIDAVGERLSEDPDSQRTLALVSMVAGLLIVAGTVWGSIWMGSLRKGERWMERFGSPKLGWTLNDVFKGLVLMFFLDLLLTTGAGFVMGFFDKEPLNLSLMSASFVRSVLVLIFLHRTARRGGGGWADLGWCSNRIWAQIGWGWAGYLAMIPVYAAVLGVLMALLSWFRVEAPVQAPVQVLYTESNAAAIWGFAVFMGVLGPWFEEIFFRGFLYPAVRARTGVWRGALLTSVLFAALHGHGIAFAPILVLGLALNLLYERSGSVVPGAVLHMTHNCAMLAVTFWVKGVTP